MNPGRGRGKPANPPPPGSGEPTAAAAGPTLTLATALAAAAGDPELAAGLVTLELMARIVLGERAPILMALTAAEPDGVLDRAMRGE